MLFCALEAVDGETCSLKELEMMLCMLLCMLEALEGRLCSLEVLEAMLCMLLCMLEVMRCMLLRMLDAVEGGLGFRVSKFPLWQFSRCSSPPLCKIVGLLRDGTKPREKRKRLACY